ncbi:MAG: V-type ATPase subunit [Clostridia bacterium]|nr:V-type ATPase subunit [Clostridia bacterium]
MRDTDYAYAVARIRANENGLLPNSAVAQLIACPGYEEAVKQLRSRGLDIVGADYESALKERLRSSWALIQEILPEKDALDWLIIENDFYNLKISLKAEYGDLKGYERLFARPSAFDPAEIDRAIAKHEFEKLPELLKEPAELGFKVLRETDFAQVSDSVLDRCCIETMAGLAEKAKDGFAKEINRLRCAFACIRTFYRCTLLKKPESFMTHAVPTPVCGGLDTAGLIKAACDGPAKLLEALSHTDFADESEALKSSSAAFEIMCADRLTETAREGGKGAFGPAPVAAYYLAVVAETECLRVILSGKLNGEPNEVISRRARRLYV